MDAFEVRRQLVADYAEYIRGFIHIHDQKIRDHVESGLTSGLLWPNPLIQLNPAFEPGDSIDELVESRILHDECAVTLTPCNYLSGARASVFPPLQAQRDAIEATSSAPAAKLPPPHTQLFVPKTSCSRTSLRGAAWRWKYPRTNDWSHSTVPLVFSCFCGRESAERILPSG